MGTNVLDTDADPLAEPLAIPLLAEPNVLAPVAVGPDDTGCDELGAAGTDEDDGRDGEALETDELDARLLERLLDDAD